MGHGVDGRREPDQVHNPSKQFLKQLRCAQSKVYPGFTSSSSGTSDKPPGRWGQSNPCLCFLMGLSGHLHVRPSLSTEPLGHKGSSV